MNLTGIPEIQFMFFLKFIQKKKLCCHLSSPSQVSENERNVGAREQWLMPIILAS
jgi:hypothetical protein